MSLFTDQVALVTGAASGIGRSVAELYAREGARVMVSDVDDRGGEETVQRILSQGGQAVYVHADVSRPVECEALVQAALDNYGRLDMACNNAGIGGQSAPTGEYDPGEWDRVIRINLSGVFYCLRYEIPAMQKNGGAVVNVASILGWVGFAQAPAYVAAKHGVLGLTKTAALEYASANIRINAIGPAFISTPMISALEEDPQTRDYLVSLHPIGRLGLPEEVAELVIWLSSDRASFVHGSYFPVDGGYLAR
jgi:NAD(P)-dependent dehydrogenase (short-subunit alcohol dehydrogenase family)